MRKRFVLFLCLFLSLYSIVKAQEYDGNLTLSTQAEVDAFNYTSVTGNLSIQGFVNAIDEITNLNGLSELVSVGKRLTISNNAALTSLAGLSSLKSIGALDLSFVALIIENNDALPNLDGLTSLERIGGLEIKGNASLTSITALSVLTEDDVRYIHIENNPALASLEGLSSIKHINGLFNPAEITLKIMANDALTSLDGFANLINVRDIVIIESNPALLTLGLSNLQMVKGSLIIKNNEVLIDLGLSNLKEIEVGNLEIISNDALADLDGLSDLENVDGDLTIENSVLTNLNGLSLLSSVGGTLKLRFNPGLTNIDGLSSLSSVGGSFHLDLNGSLTNIDGLTNLNSVGGALIISFNQSLTNINGLSSLSSVGAYLQINQNRALVNLDGLSGLTSVAQGLNISDNRPNLIDFCGLYNLFNSGTIGGQINIRGNGANTVDIALPQNVIVDADPALCSAALLDATIGTASPVGCLPEFTTAHSDFPAANIFPVGITQITWTVTDGAGNTATAIQTITVIDNQPPTITCPGNITVKCASEVPAVDINSVTATDNCSAAVTHVNDIVTNQTCVNRFTLTRTYMATDVGGNTATCAQVITVNDDVPPQIAGLTVSKEVLWPPNHKMQDITVNYTATDNCVSSPIVTITVVSDEPVNGTADGDTDPDWEIIDNHHVKLRAERAANGDGRTYTITVTVDDGCNPPVSSSKQVIVAHNITAPQSGKPFKVGSTVSFSGEFWDKPGNTHTAKWLLDGSAVANGIVSEPAGNQKGKVTGSYKFRSAGVYKLQMNVTDQNGVTSYANTNEDVDAIVVIYDPNGGYTYGGGYYNSPAGALVSNPSATGKASYGFAMNYFKNSTNPKGETQLEFKVGEFEFNALNFDYLVISNAMAQFKGTGKIIGGQSGIGFTMTVTDGQLDGTGIDKIRMKIYNKNNGTIIYDNQAGAGDATLPVHAVGSNSSIVISGSNSSLTSTNTNQIGEMEAKAPDVSSVFEVNAFPNPSATNFTITVKGNKTLEKITMQVADMYGRIIETRNVNANSMIQFGDRYRPGTYLVRIIQGKEHKEIKLVKLSD